MDTIRITKKFKFEMAHALWNYDGKCKNIHGHSYRLFVTLKGKPINDLANKKNGMVLDFGDLKKLVDKHIIKLFDHSLAINSKADYSPLFVNHEVFEKINRFDYQPTCENMIVDIAQRLRQHLPDDLKLHSLKLEETETAYAEWFAEDNS